MAMFSLIISAIRDNEKGYVNNKADYGYETKYGISKRQYPKLDIAKLTPEGALEILKKDYWDFYKIGSVENQELAEQIFLIFINMQPRNAARIVQKAVNACGKKIIIDEIFGSVTRDAVNSLPSQWLSDRIRIEAVSYYLEESDRDKSQQAFFRGWVRRALYEGVNL